MKSLLRHVCLAVLLLCTINARAAILTIGSGTATNTNFPLNTCMGYNYSQTIYLASELVTAGATPGTAGYIYSIQYYQTTSTPTANWKDWVIYMGNTTSTAFTTSTSWIPLGSLTNVFSGTVTHTGSGWYTITLTTPFYWDGTSNVVVAVDENTTSWNCTASWQCTNIGSGTNYRCITYNSDGTNPDPATITSVTATTRGLLYPNIRFDYTPAVPCTGTPTGGIATATSTSLCPGGSAVISISGATAAMGLTYQWESSPGLTGPWSPIGGATATALTVTPGTCSNTYYRRQTTCTASGISAPSSTVFISVSCVIYPPYTETFESIAAANDLPSCMTATNVGSLVYTYLSAPGSYNRTNHTPGGAKFAAFRYGANDYMYTPALGFTAGKTYRVSFWYITDGLAGWTTLSAQMGGTATAAGMTTTLGTISGATNTIYKEFSTTFTATATSTQYIGIYCNATGGPWYLSIDDINVVELPACSGAPTAGTAISTPTRICSSGSPTLSLSGTSAVTGLRYVWQSSMTGTPGSYGAIPGGTTATFTAPSISSATYYRALVICTFSGDTGISTPVYVAAGPLNPPYSENFEGISGSNELPVCMSATSVAPYVYTYLAPTGSYNQINHTLGGNKFASFRYGSNDYLFTPGLNLIAGRTYEYSFWYITDGLAGWNTLNVKVGNAPTAAAMTMPIGPTLSALTNTSYQQFKTRFVATTTGVQYVGIFCNATTGPWYLSIDDILLQELPPCSGKPVTGMPTASPARICGSGTTTLELPGLTPATGFTFLWQDSVAGGTWGTGPGRPSFGGFSAPFSTSTIMASTYFRCIVVCPASGDTAISPAVFVPAGSLNLPYYETFESITSDNQLPQCMTATSIAPYVYTSMAPTGSYNRTNHTPGGTKFASFRYGSNDYLFTPGLNLRAGYRYTFSFWYITDGLAGWTTLRAAVGNSPTATTMGTTLKTISGANNSTYRQYMDTFTVSTSGVYYGGIFCNATSGPWYLTVDDIGIQPLPCSGAPDGGFITGSVASGTPLCPGSVVTLRDSAATPAFVPGIVYQWQRRVPGTGTWMNIPGATDTIYSSATAIGWEYRFAVTCTNSGLTNYSPIYVLPAHPLHPPVEILGPAGPINYCYGDTVSLQATPFPGGVYTWKLNGKSIPGWKFNDLGATEPGIYTVEVTSPVSPCPTQSVPLELQAIDPGFSIAMATPSDSFLCKGDSRVLNSIPGLPGLALQWQRNSIDIPGATAPDYRVDESGYYRVKASNGSGCPALSRTIHMQVSPVPDAVITSPNPSYTACEDEGLQLDASLGSGFFYQWSRNGSPVFGLTDSSIIAKLPGVYTVKIRNAFNCVTISNEVTVKILPSPAISLVRTGLVLHAEATGEVLSNYQWFRNGILLPGRISDTFNLTHNGLYKVRAQGENGCYGTSFSLEVNLAELGIANVQQEEARIFPNPTESRVFLEVPVPFIVTVKDVTGRLITEGRNMTEIDLAKYSDGLYLFAIRDMEGRLLLSQRVHKRSSK